MIYSKNILIVGAGLTGCTIARILAELGWKVIIWERDELVGGMCQEFVSPHGNLVQKYGGHIFHTDDKEVWDFVNRFSDFRHYRHAVCAIHKGQYYSWPLTTKSIERFYTSSLRLVGNSQKIMKDDINSVSIKGDNFETHCLKTYGPTIYKAFIKPYSEKMWGMKLSTMDAPVAKRFTDISRSNPYFYDDRWQGIPYHGYTRMMGNMLNHENIEKVVTKALFNIATCSKVHDLHFEGELFRIIYTGTVEDYFIEPTFKSPRYRGMKFVYNYYPRETIRIPKLPHDMVSPTTINTPDEEHLLRFCLMDKLYPPKKGTTRAIQTVVYDYPSDEEKFYPIPNDLNFEKYKKLRQQLPPHIIPAGRCGTYKYLDMDEAVKNAMALAESVNEKWEKTQGQK